jgi:hypothetical protein
MKIFSAKTRCPLYVFVTLCLVVLSFGGCFQPVDLGETIVEKATARLQVTNASADDSYILMGLELRNAEGAAVWDKLDSAGEGLGKGKTWEANTEMAGTFTLWYKVKDRWISDSEVRAYNGGQVKIVLNQPNEFAFIAEDFNVPQEDSDGDGYPDAWERENGFDPADVTDGGMVYVSAVGQDTNNGTHSSPYRTLAKAVAKAGRGLTDDARTVVVQGTLTWANGGNNQLHQEYPGRSDSAFYLGKTRDRVTIRGENPDSSGILSAVGSGDKRVLYLDAGADIAFRDITITGGKGNGGGIYASGADLVLGQGTVITHNNNEMGDDLTGIKDGGGVYMANGDMVMEGNSTITASHAYMCGGVKLFASTLTMKGSSSISGNYADFAIAGLRVENSTVTMLDNAEISGNTVGKLYLPDASTPDATQRDVGGGATIIFGKITMKDSSKISGNTAYNGWGGGVQVSGMGTLLMEDSSEISGNLCTRHTNFDTTNNTSVGNGGGVFVDYGGELRMKGGKIAGNTAGRAGGGVFLGLGSSFFMERGTIYGDTETDATKKNTAAGAGDPVVYGHAVYNRNDKNATNDTITRL